MTLSPNDVAPTVNQEHGNGSAQIVNRVLCADAVDAPKHTNLAISLSQQPMHRGRRHVLSHRNARNLRSLVVITRRCLLFPRPLRLRYRICRCRFLLLRPLRTHTS